MAFENDIDRDDGLFEWEQEGIFLNYVNHTELIYGGGLVGSSPPRINNPIHMTEARPTVSFNTITLSREAAMSADPNSFEEDNFHAPKYQEFFDTRYQQDELFTADFWRGLQEQHDAGVLPNFFPYPDSERLHAADSA